MNKEFYICYDGVDGDISYYKTKDEALKMLKHYIESGLEDGEWMDDVEYSFVAKITHYVEQVEIEVEEDNKENIKYYDMIVKQTN